MVAAQNQAHTPKKVADASKDVALHGKCDAALQAVEKCCETGICKLMMIQITSLMS